MLAAASRRLWRSFSSIFLGRNSFDRLLLLAGKPIGHTHDNSENAKTEHNHHDAHDAFISYLRALGAAIKVTKKHKHITLSEPSLEIWTSL